MPPPCSPAAWPAPARRTSAPSSSPRPPAFARLRLCSDAHATTLGAHGGQPGAAIALGTGTVGDSLTRRRHHPPGRRLGLPGRRRGQRRLAGPEGARRDAASARRPRRRPARRLGPPPGHVRDLRRHRAELLSWTCSAPLDQIRHAGADGGPAGRRGRPGGAATSPATPAARSTGWPAPSTPTAPCPSAQAAASPCRLRPISTRRSSPVCVPRSAMPATAPCCSRGPWPPANAWRDA